MTARINTTVHNVPVTFDGTDATVGRAEIIETSRPQSKLRTVELFLSGLPNEIANQAKTALGSGRSVDVRVLGVYGSWTVSAVLADQERGVPTFHLKSAGPIVVGMMPAIT